MTELTPREINLKIAEMLGWTGFTHFKRAGSGLSLWVGYPPDGPKDFLTELPNFCGDISLTWQALAWMANQPVKGNRIEYFKPVINRNHDGLYLTLCFRFHHDRPPEQFIENFERISASAICRALLKLMEDEND